MAEIDNSSRSVRDVLSLSANTGRDLMLQQITSGKSLDGLNDPAQGFVSYLGLKLASENDLSISDEGVISDVVRIKNVANDLAKEFLKPEDTPNIETLGKLIYLSEYNEDADKGIDKAKERIYDYFIKQFFVENDPTEIFDQLDTFRLLDIFTEDQILSFIGGISSRLSIITPKQFRELSPIEFSDKKSNDIDILTQEGENVKVSAEAYADSVSRIRIAKILTTGFKTPLTYTENINGETQRIDRVKEAIGSLSKNYLDVLITHASDGNIYGNDKNQLARLFSDFAGGAALSDDPEVFYNSSEWFYQTINDKRLEQRLVEQIGKIFDASNVELKTLFNQLPVVNVQRPGYQLNLLSPISSIFRKNETYLEDLVGPNHKRYRLLRAFIDITRGIDYKIFDDQEKNHLFFNQINNYQTQIVEIVEKKITEKKINPTPLLNPLNLLLVEFDAFREVNPNLTFDSLLESTNYGLLLQILNIGLLDEPNKHRNYTSIALVKKLLLTYRNEAHIFDLNLDSFINEGTGKLGDKNEGTMIWSIARIGKNLRNKGIVNNLAPTEQINMQTENDKTREMIRNFSYRLISTKGDVFKSNNNSFLSEIGIEKINFVRDEETNTINLTVEMIEEESETKPIFTISIEPDKLSIINNTDALRQDRLLFDNIILNLIHELTSQEYEYDESTGTIDSKGSGKTAHFRRLPYGHNPNPKAVEDIQKLTRKPYDEVLRLWTKQGRINMDLESLNYDPTGGDLTKYWKVTFVRESRISEVSHNSQYLQSLIR